MNATLLVTGLHVLPRDRLAELVAESVREGVAFLSRLVEDWDRGRVASTRPDEALFTADRRNDARRVPPDGGQRGQCGGGRWFGGAGDAFQLSPRFPSRPRFPS
jgi:hypothetical protein